MSTPSPVTDPGAPAPGPVRRAAGAARTLAADDVRAWLRLDDGRDVELVVDVAAATTAYVDALPVAGLDPDPWPEPVYLAATMLAARWYRRRNSPAGVDQVTDAGAVYVTREDPDVARLLQFGRFAPPRIG